MTPVGRSKLSMVKWILCVVTIGSSLAAVAVAGAFYTYGSLAAAVARLQGYTIFVEQPQVFGPVAAGQVLDVSVPVQNLLDKPATILGAETDCGCVSANRLPLKLDSGSTEALSFTVSTRGVTPMMPLNQQVILRTDPPGPPVYLHIHVSVSGASTVDPT